MRSIILGLVLVTLFVTGAWAADGIYAEENWYGTRVCETSRDSGKVDTTGTPLYVATRCDSVSEVNDVTMKLGLSFGFEYTLYGGKLEEKVPLTLMAVHPEMTMPDGKTVTTRTVEYEAVMGRTEGLLYTLFKPYEMVPGKWTLRVLHKGELLLGRSFTLQ